MKLTSVRMTGILFYSQVQRSMAGFKRFLEFQISINDIFTSCCCYIVSFCAGHSVLVRWVGSDVFVRIC